MFEDARIRPNLRPLKEDVIGDVGKLLWVLMGTIGIVLLIACANVANLLLVRAEGRQQELAIRAALGAGWRRIAGELLLGERDARRDRAACSGSASRMARCACWWRWRPAGLPRVDEISHRRHGAAVRVRGVGRRRRLFGLIPVVKYGGPQLATAIRHGGRTLSQSRERHRARSTLVVVQVALALVLLVGSGLMIRTFQAMRHVQPGFTSPGATADADALDSRRAGEGPGAGDADGAGDPGEDRGDSRRRVGGAREHGADVGHEQLQPGLRRRPGAAGGQAAADPALQIRVAGISADARQPADRRPRLHLDRHLPETAGGDRHGEHGARVWGSAGGRDRQAHSREHGWHRGGRWSAWSATNATTAWTIRRRRPCTGRC